MKATNEELTTAVIKLTSVLSYMMEFNVTLAKIALPLATHLNEAEKYKLLSELEKMPMLAKQLRESCDHLTNQEQIQTDDIKTKNTAAKIEFRELSLEAEHNELKTRAETGDVKAQFQIGELFEQKSETDSEDAAQFLRNAALWFEKAAKQNYAPAQFKLAEAYSWELVFPDKKKEVHRWYQKAAEQGYEPAQLGLARSFQTGYWNDGSGDLEKAKHWFKKAAEQGVLQAEYELAALLNEESRSDEAFEIFNKLAQRGETEAQIKLAEMFEEGKGVPKDVSKSFSWYLQAAKAGDSHAFTEVGRRYLFGEGIPKNIREAIGWLMKVANPKDTVSAWDMPQAQYWLFFAYADTESPKRDFIEAYKWLNLAITYNNIEALLSQRQDARRQLAENMTQEQIEEAQRQSSELFVADDQIVKRLNGEPAS